MIQLKARLTLLIPLAASLSFLACGSSTAPSMTSLKKASSAALSAPPLGTAANFAALGGAGVTCTSPNPPLPAVTVSGGDVGSFLPAPSSVTGFPGFTPGALPCSLSGTVQLGGTGSVAAAGFAAGAGFGAQKSGSASTQALGI